MQVLTQAVRRKCEHVLEPGIVGCSFTGRKPHDLDLEVSNDAGGRNRTLAKNRLPGLGRPGRRRYERGWGEPHTLSFLGIAVPKTWFYLYYPRDADEFAVVRAIATASLDWACGGAPTNRQHAGTAKER